MKRAICLFAVLAICLGCRCAEKPGPKDMAQKTREASQ